MVELLCQNLALGLLLLVFQACSSQVKFKICRSNLGLIFLSVIEIL